jgi:hypothetical protein
VRSLPGVDIRDFGTALTSFCRSRTFVRQAVASSQKDICTVGDLCLDVGPRDLLKNFRHSLIDPDTPESAKWRKSADGKPLKLVVSIECSALSTVRLNRLSVFR